MNLEDFKSFRRVLKPSEVGSIPTHSRHLLGRPGRGDRNPGARRRMGGRTLGWLMLLALAGAPAARAQEEDAVAAPPTGPATVPPGTPRPFTRALRSAVFPAWGQLSNGKSKKAAVLLAAQTR